MTLRAAVAALSPRFRGASGRIGIGSCIPGAVQCASMVPALFLALLLLALTPPSCRGEWVEIPQLKPSSTISTTIKPPATSANVQQLLAHLSPDSRTVSSVRWVRPVSDLLDFERPWFTGQLPPDTRRLVNVSSKVEQEEEEEEEGEEPEEEEEVQTALLPFGNRYEEESIETVTPKAIEPVVQNYDDFDDYDERTDAGVHPVVTTDREYDEEGMEEDEEVERGPVTVVHVRPVASSGGGFRGFVDFLRRMQASFVQRTAHTIGDKIRTLADMRDQLMRSIERRISTLWRGNEGRGRRRRRVRRGGGWMEPHGGTDAMDFPSAEGALLTISFLTFAVFLIKLVLQVINTIKAKHYTYSTFAAATPVSGGLLVKRTRRHTPLHPDHIRAILRTLDAAQYRT